MNYTRKQWFDSVPDLNIREMLYRRTEEWVSVRSGARLDKSLEGKEKNFSFCLMGSFDWNRTSEGHIFWNKIQSHYRNLKPNIP